MTNNKLQRFNRWGGGASEKATRFPPARTCLSSRLRGNDGGVCCLALNDVTPAANFDIIAGYA